MGLRLAIPLRLCSLVHGAGREGLLLQLAPAILGIFDSAQYEVGAARYPQLSKDAVKVNFHCPFTDPKLPRDNFVRQPLRDKPHYFRFSPRERLTGKLVPGPILFCILHNTLPGELATRPLNHGLAAISSAFGDYGSLAPQLMMIFIDEYVTQITARNISELT